MLIEYNIMLIDCMNPSLPNSAGRSRFHSVRSSIDIVVLSANSFDSQQENLL
jgi:hypothetical protein